MRYVLNRGNWRAVVDTVGAEMVSCSEKGLEYIWSGDPAFWTGHAPVLFPAVCALRNDRTSFGGVPYPMKQHGFARKCEFTVVSAEEDRITMQLSDSAETREQYPFSFSLTVTHALTDDGFSTDYEVRNTDTSVLPFALGGHAGFCCPLRPGEMFSDYQVLFDCKEDPVAWLLDDKGLMDPDHRKTALTPVKDGMILPVTEAMFADSALVFPHVQSGKLSLLHRVKKTGLDFTFHNFCNLGIWTPPGKGAPFLCLEPWQGLPALAKDAWIFEEKEDVVFLPAGETFQAGYAMIRRA